MKQRLLFMLLALVTLMPRQLSAFTYQYEGTTLRYDIIDEKAKTCRVGGHQEVSGNLVIPDIANDGTSDYTVASIGEWAFLNCSDLTSVVIPNSVLSIEGCVFYGCSSLTSVHIPDSVTSFGDYVFNGCSSLISVVIPNSVTSIGKWTFGNCNSLTSVHIPDSVTSFGDYAFNGCSSLTSLVIPNSVTSIGEWTFQNCSSLTSADIPNSVTSIGEHAFFNCSSLTSMVIPNSMTSIGEWTFQMCTGLTTVVIPNSVTEICEHAFEQCHGLRNIVIGCGIKEIGDNAFVFDSFWKPSIYITAPNPPIDYPNSFASHSGTLYLQNMEAMEAYYNALGFWYLFSMNTMIEPTGIKLTEGESTIKGKPGEKIQLNAVLQPENVTLPQIFWSSTNPDIATVDNNGLVTLHADLEEVLTRAEGDGHCKIIAESLYADGPLLEVNVFVDTNGVDEIFQESFSCDIDYSRPYEVYNLNGVKVGESKEGLDNGFYVVRQGNSAMKICVKY